jgi:hypothetical protein
MKDDASDPVPGDLFVVRELAEFPLEWAVVARDPHDGSRLLVVPADAHPATGSADVRVPARASGGPLNLRCGFPVWLPGSVFDPGLRTGWLEASDVLRAERRVDELGRGKPRGEQLGSETDRDPEYLDWIADTVAPAAEALAAAVRRGASGTRSDSAPVTPGRSRPNRFLGLAAAALVLAALGLSFRIVWLQREVERLSGPLFDLPAGEVVLGGAIRNPERNPVRIRVRRGASHVLLTVVLGSDLPAGGLGYIEVQDLEGRSLWRSPPFALAPAGELNLVLPRRLLPGHTYRLALYRRGSSVPIRLRALELETSP